MRRLVQLDVDSTFIQQEVIELLAAHAGVLEQVSQITESAMRGEIDFSQSLIARVKLLEGLSEDVIKQVQSEIVLTDGAADLVKKLHEASHLVALVSGGFMNILSPLISLHKIDFYRANTLEIKDGKLTGEVILPIVDRAAKAQALREFAASSGIALEQTVAIGDGANDLDMMEIAGVSIAFNAKPIVVRAADYSINEPSLRSVSEILDL